MASLPLSVLSRFTVGLAFVRRQIPNFGPEWENQAGIAPWYRQPAVHPFHCPTVRNGGYSQGGLFPD